MALLPCLCHNEPTIRTLESLCLMRLSCTRWVSTSGWVTLIGCSGMATQSIPISVLARSRVMGGWSETQPLSVSYRSGRRQRDGWVAPKDQEKVCSVFSNETFINLEPWQIRGFHVYFPKSRAGTIRWAWLRKAARPD